MKGIVVTTNNVIEVKEFSRPLHESCRSTLGGYIERVSPPGLKRPFCMLVNDEGLLRDLPINYIGSILYGTAKHGCPICGNLIIMKTGWTLDGYDIVGLKNSEIAELLSQLNPIAKVLKSTVATV